MKKVKTGESSDRSPPSGDQSGQPPNKQKTLAGKNKQGQASEKVQKDKVTGRLKELETRLTDDLPIDAQRINDMKNAIASGEYKVDAESIANKMIDLESSLKK
jgi:negative regulator of flagellin synthesis FlgM